MGILARHVHEQQLAVLHYPFAPRVVEDGRVGARADDARVSRPPAPGRAPHPFGLGPHRALARPRPHQGYRGAEALLGQADAVLHDRQLCRRVPRPHLRQRPTEVLDRHPRQPVRHFRVELEVFGLALASGVRQHHLPEGGRPPGEVQHQAQLSATAIPIDFLETVLLAQRLAQGLALTGPALPLGVAALEEEELSVGALLGRQHQDRVRVLDPRQVEEVPRRPVAERVLLAFGVDHRHALPHGVHERPAPLGVHRGCLGLRRLAERGQWRFGGRHRERRGTQQEDCGQPRNGQGHGGSFRGEGAMLSRRYESDKRVGIAERMALDGGFCPRHLAQTDPNGSAARSATQVRRDGGRPIQNYGFGVSSTATKPSFSRSSPQSAGSRVLSGPAQRTPPPPSS